MLETSHPAPRRRRVDRIGPEAVRPLPARGSNLLRPANLALPAIHRSMHPPLDLATVNDAAEFIVRLEPERQAQPWWENCGLALVRASKSGRRRDVERAAELLETALRQENRLAATKRIRGPDAAGRGSARRQRQAHNQQDSGTTRVVGWWQFRLT
jgi:hypothetical protein